MKLDEVVPERVRKTIESQPDRFVDCPYCERRHHPYMPCVADEHTICKVCGETGHFECTYYG